MIFYPDIYLETIKDITYELLEKNNIHAIILDMDNTLIDYNANVLDGAKQWADELRKKGIKFLIVSNSNKKEKLEKVSKELNMEYISFALKPFKIGLKKAIKKLQEKPKNIAAVGDQVFTDVIGAKRSKMFSILVKPLDEKDILLTIIKRPLENYILKKYQEKGKK